MKKGFTLIEMIGSIIILAIIALVAFPTILNMINSSQGKIDSGKKDYVIGAAKEYVDDHVNDFPRVSSLNKNVTVSTLLSEGYITKKSIEDSMNNDYVKVSIKTNNISENGVNRNVNIYTYEYIEV